MICNSPVTIYHKSIDEETNLEVWNRHNYDNAWVFESNIATINNGYDNVNGIEVRLPYNKNKLNINDFSIGDIIIKGKITLDITKQQDLKDYWVHNITSINNNNFGSEKHIHLGGR